MRCQHDVLVVDDDKALNKLICHFVELAGHSAHSVFDGGSALLAAREHAPALVLLDLMLPDITGFEVCRALRRDGRTSAATVVMVTALGDDASRREGMCCGATEYLVKPFGPDALIETIRKYAASIRSEDGIDLVEAREHLDQTGPLPI
jgi:DNA-binding response OmpR family regulator